jgi:hypothetical protein
MKKSRLLGTVCAGIFISLPSHAALVDNGGGLIYDTVLDITWAQPAYTLRNWNDANTWAAGYTRGGVSGWRLPYISVAAGTGPFAGTPVDCNTASELDCRDNEMGYMFYHNLSGTSGQPILTIGDPDLALFPSLQSIDYWSGTGINSFTAWNFHFNYGGVQIDDIKNFNFNSWAVHAGDIHPIPIPTAVWLFGSGLLGLIGISRRKKAA